MGKHTPGPWAWGWRNDADAPGSVHAASDYYAIAMCPKYGRKDWPANAALIATAPDQYALLVEALDLAPRINDDDPMAPALADWCKRVRAVLARAEGRS